MEQGKKKGSYMNQKESGEIELLCANNFFKRCRSFIQEGSSKSFPKTEKRLWKEFKDLTMVPVAFKTEVDKKNALSDDASAGHERYWNMLNILKDLLAQLEHKKNSYAELLSELVLKESHNVMRTMFCLLDIGVLATEIVAGKGTTLYIHPYCLEDIYNLYNEEMFGNQHLLERIDPKEYHEKSIYFTIPDSLLKGICETHVFYRQAKTNNTISDETTVFFQTRRPKFTPFSLVSNMRERYEGYHKTFTQDCFVYDPEVKKKAENVDKIEGELKTIFKIAPIIHKLYNLKKGKFKLYKDGYIINEPIGELEAALKEYPSKVNTRENFLEDNILWKSFFKKES